MLTIWNVIHEAAVTAGNFSSKSGKVHPICNNPTLRVIHKAEQVWENHGIACIVSLGAGKLPIFRDNTSGPSNLEVEVSVSSQQVHQHMRRDKHHGAYFRFDVEQGMSTVSAETLGHIKSHTESYVHVLFAKYALLIPFILATSVMQQLRKIWKLLRRFTEHQDLKSRHTIRLLYIKYFLCNTPCSSYLVVCSHFILNSHLISQRGCSNSNTSLIGRIGQPNVVIRDSIKRKDHTIVANSLQKKVYYSLSVMLEY